MVNVFKQEENGQEISYNHNFKGILKPISDFSQTDTQDLNPYNQKQ